MIQGSVCFFCFVFNTNRANFVDVDLFIGWYLPKQIISVGFNLVFKVFPFSLTHFTFANSPKETAYIVFLQSKLDSGEKFYF